MRMHSDFVTVAVDLRHVRENAADIRARTGRKLIAVIKADAYGLGAERVADALEGVADDFAYFTVAEARRVGRPGIVIGPALGEPATYREAAVRPTISTIEEARRFAGTPVAINLDTGMQRFGCPPEEFEALLAACDCDEVWTHAGAACAARRLGELARAKAAFLHAACSSLLDQPEAYYDAVRPGYALYRGAVRVSTPLTRVRHTSGPIGYSGFAAERIGVIMAGYSHGLQPGPVVINGRRQQILEVGMNTSCVTVARDDAVGDAVALLGDGLTEEELARHFGTRPHAVLCRYTALGRREYASASHANVAATDSPDTTQLSVAAPRGT